MLFSIYFKEPSFLMAYGNIMGIDLGTTYCCVGVVKNGHVEILENEYNSLTTPSCISYSKDTLDYFVGDSAKKNQVFNPKNTIDNIKRVIGRRYADIELKEDMRHFGYNIVEVQGSPIIEYQQQNAKKHLSPEEASSMLLRRMKDIARKVTKTEMNKAVITIPNHFNTAQRNATMDAAKLAGIELLGLVKEPSAASLSYKINTERNELVLVYDLGGGTFDVSLVQVSKNSNKILAVSGDTHLGGENFNQRIVELLITEIRQNIHEEVTPGSCEFRRLHNAAERVKRALSNNKSVDIDLYSLINNKNFKHVFRRDNFEKLCLDLFNKTLEHIDSVLKDSKTSKNHVGSIVMVGGSTRIPKVRNMVSAYFGGKKLDLSMNPDTCVAYGATLQASILTKGDNNLRNRIIFHEDLVLLDVVPISIGLGSVEGKMNKIFYRNSPMPCETAVILTTDSENQTSIDFPICEGERALTGDNQNIGTILLDKIPSMRRGEIDIVCICSLDDKGDLKFVAGEHDSKYEKILRVDFSSYRLSESRIKEMLKDADLHKEQDAIVAKRIDDMLELSQCIYKAKRFCEENKQIDTEQFLKLVKEVDSWLSLHRENPSINHVNRMKEIKELAKDLKLNIWTGFDKRTREREYQDKYIKLEDWDFL